MALARVKTSRLVELLAPAIGREKAQTLVSGLTRQMGVVSEELSFEQATSLLETLAKSSGAEAVAARVAIKRLDARDDYMPESGSGQPSSHSVPSGPKGLVSMRELIDGLAKSLGKEKSEEVVTSTASLLGIVGESIPKESALLILERLATQPGLIGVTARFAKTRFILHFADRG